MTTNRGTVIMTENLFRNTRKENLNGRTTERTETEKASRQRNETKEARWRSQTGAKGYEAPKTRDTTSQTGRRQETSERPNKNIDSQGQILVVDGT